MDLSLHEGNLDSGGSSDKFENGASIRAIAGLLAITASFMSTFSVWSHLKHYRKPSLQRYVVRIILMVPIYAISSWISLTSTYASFYVDGIRDIYEAFVIYCFFILLVNYLGGERALLILLHGRPPTPHIFPVNLFVKEMDIGDPYVFLFLKRGILQYVYLKPVLAVITMILKWAETYDEGHIEITNGYLWISLIYNASCSLCFYCLVIFYVCTKDDLKPYRPIPKFLCVKAVIFFSFWQGFALSLLVYFGVIHDSEVNTAESISVSIQDFLITFEMLLAAIAHWYAFSYEDYIDHSGRSGRMPIKYAFKDCMGFRDVIYDTLETIRGSRFNYRTFEPAEGIAHVGPSRTARIMAGLRFTSGGAGKYWLPGPNSRTTLLSGGLDDDSNSINFHDPDPTDEVESMYTHSRKLGKYGDYNFPVVDANGYEYIDPPPPSNLMRKGSMSKRKLKGKGKADEIYFGVEHDDLDSDDMESQLPGGKKRQFSDANVPPFRNGCVDLVRKVSNDNRKGFESHFDNVNSTSTMQPYASISMRDPFIQTPEISRNISHPLPINRVQPQEIDNDSKNENIDPLGALNRASYLSTSMKSVEKNIWSDDFWK